MATNYCVSVGQVLASDLKASGITQKELSKRTNIQESVISEIINGRRKMSKNVAIALESVFELPAGYWLEIQNEYELAKEKDGMTIIVKDGSYETTDISAIDIANWFILRAKKDVETSGEYITQLKLQKLLYFAQEKSLKTAGRKLFKEPIYHWEYGPVVKIVYNKYKEYKANPITEAETPKLDSKTIKLLEQTYNQFGKYSAQGLVTISHRTSAWRNTNISEEITPEIILKSAKIRQNI